MCKCVCVSVCESESFLLLNKLFLFWGGIFNLHWSSTFKHWLQAHWECAMSHSHCGIWTSWHHSAAHPLALQAWFVTLLWLLYLEPISGSTYRQQDGNKLSVKTKPLLSFHLSTKTHVSCLSLCQSFRTLTCNTIIFVWQKSSVPNNDWPFTIFF